MDSGRALQVHLEDYLNSAFGNAKDTLEEQAAKRLVEHSCSCRPFLHQWDAARCNS